MSHWYGFNILPFDWRATPKAEVQLPIDIDDFAQHLQAQCPTGEVNVFNQKDSSEVRLYITSEQYGPRLVANLRLDKNTILDISAWPKPLAVRLILWYRKYVNLKCRLFIVESIDGDTIELTENTSQQDVENHFPHNWELAEWDGS
jgi:hypothetical protein